MNDRVGQNKPAGQDKAGPALTLLSEENAAERVGLEREYRRWSTAELAKRMTAAGYPMNQSAVWRIESGEPRRRINLDEAIGFAKVFDLPLEEFLGPPESSSDKHTQQLADLAVGRYRALLDLIGTTDHMFGLVDAYSATYPEHADKLRSRIARGIAEENRRRGPMGQSPMIFLRYPAFQEPPAAES